MSEEHVDITHLKIWEGRQETVSDTITAQLLRGFMAILDRAADDLSAGTPVPQALHWCLSPPTVPMHELGPDGHPARGGFLPPVPLPRRMWAGGRLTFHDALRVGDVVTRSSTIKSVTVKEGRTGPLCFVMVGHEIASGRGLAIEEEHDIVYRGLAGPAVGEPPREAQMGKAEISREVKPDPVLLFRYSALTYNGHRIHYDRDYVTRVEGYPGLIVHGPLQATMLMQLAVALKGGAPVRKFAFRAMSPLFDLSPFALKGAMDGAEKARLWTAGENGTLHMQATAEW